MQPDNIEIHLPSILGYEKIARRAAEAVAEQMEFNEARIEDLKTAVAEACMNAIEHGNNLDRAIHVTVQMLILPDKLEVRVADIGAQTIPDVLPPPGTGEMRGWGMFFIRNLVDEMEIKRLPDGGNEIRMTIYLVRKGDAPGGTDGASAAALAAAEKTAATAAVQVVEEKPVALQAIEEKVVAVQPVEDKPVALQPLADRPVTLQVPQEIPAVLPPAEPTPVTPPPAQAAASPVAAAGDPLAASQPAGITPDPVQTVERQPDSSQTIAPPVATDQAVPGTGTAPTPQES